MTSRIRLYASLIAAAGLLILAHTAQTGWASFMWMVVPGALMVSAGTRGFVSPDLRSPQHGAAGALIGIFTALPVTYTGSISLALICFTASAIAFVSSGCLAISLDPAIPNVPSPSPRSPYGARVALDDAIVCMMTSMTPLPSQGDLRAAANESRQAVELLEANNWSGNPAAFHASPPPLSDVHATRRKLGGMQVEHINFESGYEPVAGFPGRDRFLSHRNNRTCHAWIARHDTPGPWLVCVHGFGMGVPSRDIPTFRTSQLHSLGLNVALIALPMHGPRSSPGFNGKAFIGLSPVDFVLTESQSIWDLRRLLGWIRTQGATRIGLHGISLGGYTSALLAGLEDGIECVIAGVPPSDLIATGLHFSCSYDRRLADAAGVDYERDRALHSVVSPLTVTPRMPREQRFIYAATGDRFVAVEQVKRLWEHWEQPRISWCTGGHVSALMQRAPRTLVDEVASTSLLGPAA